ncbi:hypothetical protein A6D65_25190 [Salmonella enterica subsp. enterica serovar Havana]|nr:hypothetical protein [Salmonella enterica subsp. enterica serovar Havana]
MDSITPEKLAAVGAVEAYPDLMPGILFVTCPDAAKSCVSLSTCKRLLDKATTRKADPEACARPCLRCATGSILWRGSSSPMPPVHIECCPRCGKTGGRLVGKTSGIHAGFKPTPWNLCCVSCWNRVAENKKGAGARGNPIIQPPLIAPWLIGHVEDGVPVWSVWIGDSQSEAIQRQLLRNPSTQFNNQQPGITGFDTSGHPVYFCDKHPQTALHWDWDKDAPTVGRVQFYCPDCEPKARPLPLAMPRAPLQFMTAQEAAQVYSSFTGKTDTAAICADCHRAPLHIASASSGAVMASCPCCGANALSDADNTHNWLDVEPIQPRFFSVYRAAYNDFPLSGSGAAALQSVPSLPLTLERGDGPELAPLEQLRALK